MRTNGEGRYVSQFKIIFPLVLVKKLVFISLGNKNKVSEKAGSENIWKHNKEIKEKKKNNLKANRC